MTHEQPNAMFTEALKSKLDAGLDVVEADENGLGVQYVGYGDDYFRILTDDADTDTQFKVRYIAGTSPRVNPSDSLRFIFGEKPGLVEIHHQGLVEGGITVDGEIYHRGYQDESGAWLDRHIESMRQQKENDQALGITRVFTPSLASFNPETQRDITQSQRVNYIKGKLLVHTSDAPLEDEVNPFGDIYSPLDHLVEQTATTLAPVYDVKLANKRFFASAPMQLEGSDRLFMAMYNDEAPQVPLLFYRSNSHGVWRAAIATAQTKTEGRWYAKGMFGAENSVDAPIALQKYFDGVVATSPYPRELKQVVLDGLTATSSLHTQGRYTRRSDIESGTERYAQSILELATITGWGTERATYDPYDFSEDRKLFTSASKPNFGEPQDSWTTSTAFYDEVLATVYPSKNGLVNYLVYEAEFEGRVQRWVATAEYAGAPVTRIGLPRWWPKLLSEVIAPPIDYEKPKDGTESMGYAERRQSKTRFDVFAARSIAAYKGLKKR